MDMMREVVTSFAPILYNRLREQERIGLKMVLVLRI
jgi:hypothetical protein